MNMTFKKDSFISGGSNIYYPGVIRSIKKSTNTLAPVFEAFTNALEAIKDLQKNTQIQGQITIKIYQHLQIDNSTQFDKIIIHDNGKGFDDFEFGRFIRYKDFSKGYKNLGSGRIQYVHFFNQTHISSIFHESNEFFKRDFIVSKRDEFVKDNNAIIKHLLTDKTEIRESGTYISFSGLLDVSQQTYHELTAKDLKEKLIRRYLQYFCINKDRLPSINIHQYVQGELKDEQTIQSKDIPNVDKESQISINYQRVAQAKNGISLAKTDKVETFDLKAYKVEKNTIGGNAIRITSKDEIIEDFELELSSLSKSDIIGESQYLFLISSDYIDSRDNDTRGNLEIPSLKSLAQTYTPMDSLEVITIDDITTSVNQEIDTQYPEFQAIKKKHHEDFQKLKEMFLLDEKVISEVRVSINDNENKILEKIYSHEARKVAKLDASIKERIERLEKLDTTSESYQEDLETEILELSKSIPQQNKVALTHYIARRKLVLELFNKILDRKLHIQKTSSKNFDEKLLHNLVFQQSSNNPEKSDLWLVNEDFIYFKGTSEEKLKDIQIGGEKLLRENLTEEEEKFRKDLDEDRLIKRPDILLFPEESKCIIIEFKNPSVNVSEHLSQINNYATLIWNFSQDKFRFDTFYGYLIGEKMSAMDVRSYDNDFKEAFNFDYLFRPNKTVAGFFNRGKNDASLYTEVIKYSTLLERAKKRNEVFISKLINS